MKFPVERNPGPSLSRRDGIFGCFAHIVLCPIPGAQSSLFLLHPVDVTWGCLASFKEHVLSYCFIFIFALTLQLLEP